MRTFGNGVWTSELASKTSKKERNESLVWSVLVAAGQYGMTDDEMQAALDMDGNSQRPARVSLRKKGWVYDTEEVRLTRKGHPAIVRRVVSNTSREL